MAPESAKRPFGALALASLPLIVELLIVSGPRLLTMAPPSASLAMFDNPDAVPTRLLLTVVFVSVSVPQLSIPPPFAAANGHATFPGHGGPIGRVFVGATRLSVMTLLEIVTVAPPVKSAFGGISTPPPAGNHASLADSRNRFRTRPRHTVRDRDPGDRDGRLGRRAVGADRQYRPAAADHRRAGPRPD